MRPKRPLRFGEKFNESIHIDRRTQNQPVIQRDELNWFKEPPTHSMELKAQARTVRRETENGKSIFYLKDLREHKPKTLKQALPLIRKKRAEQN
ncbi:MAG: hypothetical protein J4215_01255 [Candidatus Diapherotrites archaeon]|uniref:Uncharacterized protein n=1 Tax=Candidatus Iainarchaeum sp. TaxID=3101447 RepID=A0A8T4L5R1_9ARCH|nr:hypothetical protein [Candidatus Diapherotrites archaeon]